MERSRKTEQHNSSFNKRLRLVFSKFRDRNGNRKRKEREFGFVFVFGYGFGFCNKERDLFFFGCCVKYFTYPCHVGRGPNGTLSTPTFLFFFNYNFKI